MNPPQIHLIVRERLSQITSIRPFTCRHCGEDIIFVKTRNGGTMPLDLELRKHVCKRKENRGGNYGRL